MRVIKDRLLDAFTKEKYQIDFTDMLHYAVQDQVQVSKTQQFDILYVDEGQDLSSVRFKLAQKMLAPGGRMVVVGDPHQAIYGFTGAFADIFLSLAEKPGWKLFGMTRTYRCSKALAKAARQYDPTIQALDNAPEGAITDAPTIEIEEGSNYNEHVVLCRNNAPLVKWRFKLHNMGIPATLVGEDVREHLLAKVEQYFGSGKNHSKTGFIEFLDNLGSGTRTESDRMSDNPLSDIVECLHLLSADVEVKLTVKRGPAYHTNRRRSRQNRETQRLREAWEGAINEAFARKPNAVKLMTIHKSKGGEWDHIWVVNSELVPSPNAKLTWEKIQELNLLFVMFTRGRLTLTYVRP